MKNLVVACLGAASLFLSTQADAFPTSVSTHQCVGGSPYNTAVVTWTDHDLSSESLVWNTTGTSSPVFQQLMLRFSGDTVSMERPVVKQEGFKSENWTFKSLDPLHLDPSKRYTVKVYATSDFLWLEVFRRDILAYPVYSTVFFVGAPDYLMRVSLGGEKSGIKCTALDDVKADIQKNYADIYNPKYPLYIQYTRESMAALQIYRYNP
jgi:hypothetical protein